MIEMVCPHCGHRLRIDEKFQGKRGACRHCQGTIEVPRFAALPTVGSTQPPDTPPVDLDSIEAQISRPSILDKMEEQVGQEGLRQVTITCLHCRMPMDIDASICPHCRKPGGITHSFMLIGGLLGLIVGGTIEYFWVFGGSDVDTMGAVTCSLCVCNPVFWAIAFPSMIVGSIAGAITAYYKKQKMKGLR